MSGLLGGETQLNIIPGGLSHLGKNAAEAALLQFFNGNGGQYTWVWHSRIPSIAVSW
jgi:hypothetical protein